MQSTQRGFEGTRNHLDDFNLLILSPVEEFLSLQGALGVPRILTPQNVDIFCDLHVCLVAKQAATLIRSGVVRNDDTASPTVMKCWALMTRKVPIMAKSLMTLATMTTMRMARLYCKVHISGAGDARQYWSDCPLAKELPFSISIKTKQVTEWTRTHTIDTLLFLQKIIESRDRIIIASRVR